MLHRSNARFIPRADVTKMDCPVDKGLVKAFHSGASGPAWEVLPYVGAMAKDSSSSLSATPAMDPALGVAPAWMMASRGGWVAP